MARALGTADRGTGLSEPKHQQHEARDQDVEAAIFHLTSLFERIIWLLRQLGASVQAEGVAPRPAPRA